MLAGVWAVRPRPLLIRPGILKNMNSNRSMVLDAKTVTHLNSARVSFVNRRKNGDSFAKALAARGSHCVGPRSRERATTWATLVRARGSLWWAEPRRELGRAVEYVFKFPVKYKRLFN